jgi:hypothetical protein
MAQGIAMTSLTLALTLFVTPLGLPSVLSPNSLGQALGDSADSLVQQLREFPASLPGIARSDGSIDPVEQRREKVWAGLRALEQDALPALARGLSDSDVQVRRNVALFLEAASSASYNTPRGRRPMDIRRCLSELTAALADSDGRVRELAAQAIGEIGVEAAPAVPALVLLLKNPDVGSRCAACIGLTGIGAVAKDALPALRAALADPNPDVRRFAQRAVDKIEARCALARQLGIPDPNPSVTRPALVAR